jgi:hypothetical protein
MKMSNPNRIVSHYFIIISPDFRLYDVIIASYDYSSTEHSSVIKVCVCVKSELGYFAQYVYLIKGINLKKKLVKCYIWSIHCMVLKLGHFRK